MTKHFILFLFTCLTIHASAFNKKDSLVKISELKFKNEMERTAFKKINPLLKEQDITDLFISSFDQEEDKNSTEIHQKIEDCVNNLHLRMAGKSEAKQVKIIYEYVHKTFLKVYKLRNSFSDIFEKGEYNCVSATALYAIIFQKLNIPFQIKETPTHVYLMTYPQSFKILIETTSPANGYYQFNSSFIEKYVKNLYNNKIITKQEYDTSSVNNLFNRYYFTSSNISLLELSGIQYSNYGVFHAEDKNYEKAIIDFKKACYLYPCYRNEYLLMTSLIYTLSNNDYKNSESVNYLITLCYYNNNKNNEVSNEDIKNEFIRLTQYQLINNSNRSFYEASFNQIKSALKDTELISEISFIYHYELARLGYLNGGKNDEQFSHLKEAYQANPKNADLQNIILADFSKRIERTEQTTEIIKLIDQYTTQFDFLKTHKEFNSVKANCILELAFENLSMNNLIKGEAYLTEFENLYKEIPGLDPRQIFIEKAYSAAAAIYYKKGNYSKAKQFLKTGLIYSPDNFGLKQRLSQF